MRFARIETGVVAEILVIDDAAEIEQLFHPDVVATCHACGPEVEEGWVLNGSTFEPAPEAEPLPAELVAYVADRRWRAEQAGAIWNGWPIHTDDRSQGKYLSELQAVALNVRVDNDPWKFADGVFRPVSNADFPQLAIAAREHVRTAFGIEGTVLAHIEAGAITTREQIDAAFTSL